ncbi:MAG: pirin-like C-terminal cupin domain-containing protein, partial [Cyclobacteriaceae bacterium]
GEYEGQTGPMDSITGLTMLSVDIEANHEFRINIPEGRETLYYVVKGKLAVNGKEARMHDLVRFDHEKGEISTAVKEDTTLIIGHGEPFNEPIVAQGPFVMNSEKEIMEAFQDYQQGKLGTWS